MLRFAVVFQKPHEAYTSILHSKRVPRQLPYDQLDPFVGSLIVPEQCEVISCQIQDQSQEHKYATKAPNGFSCVVNLDCQRNGTDDACDGQNCNEG